MRIVIAKMHSKERKVILQEVEFDGSIKNLCELLNLDKYEKSVQGEDDLYASRASNLIITNDHVYIDNGYEKGTGRQWRINDMVLSDGYEIAFVGLANILEGKPLLTIEYLRSTIMHASRENPDILTEEEELELEKQYDN